MRAYLAYMTSDLIISDFSLQLFLRTFLTATAAIHVFFVLIHWLILFISDRLRPLELLRIGSMSRRSYKVLRHWMLHLIGRRGWVGILRIVLNIVLWVVIGSSGVRLIVDWLLGIESFI